MNELQSPLGQDPLLVLLILARVAATLVSIPAIGTGVPNRIRATLAILITFVICASVSEHAQGPPRPELHPLDLALLIGRELIIGCLIGFTVRIAILGLQAAGDLVSGTGGLQLAGSNDPHSGESLTPLSQWFGLLIATIFLAVGGHRMVLAAMIESFVALPPGKIQFQEPMLELLLTQWTASLAAGIQVAVPMVLALLLSNLVIGLISRTLPQLNLLAIGMSLNLLALLSVTTLTIGSAGYLFREHLQVAIDQLNLFWFGPD